MKKAENACKQFSPGWNGLSRTLQDPFSNTSGKKLRVDFWRFWHFRTLISYEFLRFLRYKNGLRFDRSVATWCAYVYPGNYHYSLFRINWHPIFLRKELFLLRKTVIFLHKSLWNALRIIIINFIFELAQPCKSSFKGQIIRKPP